jgi:hypothetical protein
MKRGNVVQPSSSRWVKAPGVAFSKKGYIKLTSDHYSAHCCDGLGADDLNEPDRGV